LQTQNVSEQNQKHFLCPGHVSATNVARAGKRGNICVGNNVSSTMCPRLPGPLANHDDDGNEITTRQNINKENNSCARAL